MGLAIQDKQYAQILDAAENRRVLYSNDAGDLVSVNRWNFFKRIKFSLNGYQRSDLDKVINAVKNKFTSEFVHQVYFADPNNQEIARARDALISLETRFVRKNRDLKGCFDGVRNAILGTIIEQVNEDAIPIVSNDDSARSRTPSPSIFSRRSSSPLPTSPNSGSSSSRASTPTMSESPREDVSESTFASLAYYDSAMAPRLRMQGVSESDLETLRQTLPRTNFHSKPAADRFAAAYFNEAKNRTFTDRWARDLKEQYHLSDREIDVIRQGFFTPENDYEGWVETKALNAVKERNKKKWEGGHRVSLKSRVEWKYGLEEADLPTLRLEELFSIKDPDEFTQRLEERAKEAALAKFSYLCNADARSFATRVGFSPQKYETFFSQFGHLFQNSIEGKEYSFDSEEKRAAFTDTRLRAVYKNVLVDLISDPRISQYAAQLDGKDWALDFRREAKEDLLPKLLEIIANSGDKKEWPALVNRVINRYLITRYASYAMDADPLSLNKADCKGIVQEALRNVYPDLSLQAAIHRGEIPLLAGHEAIVSETKRLAVLKGETNRAKRERPIEVGSYGPLR